MADRNLENIHTILHCQICEEWTKIPNSRAPTGKIPRASPALNTSSGHVCAPVPKRGTSSRTGWSYRHGFTRSQSYSMALFTRNVCVNVNINLSFSIVFTFMETQAQRIGFRPILRACVCVTFDTIQNLNQSQTMVLALMLSVNRPFGKRKENRDPPIQRHFFDATIFS